MDRRNKVFIFGGGRVGIHLTAELLRSNIDVVVADCLNKDVLSKKLSRIYSDVIISSNKGIS